MDNYLTPSHTQGFELIIKRSRFITHVAHVNNKAEAKAFIETMRLQFSDASHHCWACIAGRPDEVRLIDQSDDGEPKGTAGKPILNVLQHSLLGNTVIVVTRYFGGIKLGAGGLVRAYSQSASEATQQLKTRTQLICSTLHIELPYSQLDSFTHWLNETEITIKDKLFNESVILSLQVPCSQLKDFKALLSTKTNGAARFLEPVLETFSRH